jgi:polysaccharide biosynthesis protein PslH
VRCDGVKVLLLTQVLPYPLDSGPKIKTHGVLKFLAPRHEVTLLSFARGDQRAEVRQLQRQCAAVHVVPMMRRSRDDVIALLRSTLCGEPWVMMRDDRAVMRRRVDELTRQTAFDVVHADQLNMAQYALRVRGARRVLDAHNALWLLYKRLWQITRAGVQKWLLGRDWRLLKAYEGRLCRTFEAVLAVSETDKLALQEAAEGKTNITVVPIALDTEAILPVAREPIADHVICAGTMYWPPNSDGVQWFASEVWPRIRAQRPTAVFDVIGAAPPRRVMALAQSGAGIAVAGYVPDMSAYLRCAGVFVVPLRAGGGMRVKILTAMAQGLPIVSTALGCEGIDAQSGRDLLIADTPAEFAAAVVRVLTDVDLATRLSASGRRLVVERYDYRRACRPLDDVYRGLAVPQASS